MRGINRLTRLAMAGMLIISGGASLRAAERQPAAPPKAAPQIAQALAGAWKAPAYKVERSSALDTSLFGPRASDVRNVDLSLQPNGEGVLKVFTSVVDRKGKTYSPSVIEAQITVGAPEPTYVAGKVRPDVTVSRAEERYLDGTGDHFPAEVASASHKS